ncbi:MAG: hypothetical protein JXO51_07860 [Candidatus Aminicenantes bacterium]|nr:hypothetical protein [Candidatus Aminicenantes bacterium]
MKEARGRMRMRFGVMAAVVFASGPAFRLAVIGAPTARMQIEKVALFKNGIGYFSASATLPGGERTIRFGQLPIPLYGTFWVGYGREVKVRSLVTAMEEREERIPVQSLGQLLLANAGRRVILRAGPGEKDIIEGVILPGGGAASPADPGNPYFMDYRRQQGDRIQPSLPDARLLLIRTDKGTVALNAGAVARADFGADALHTTLPVRHSRPSIRMELDAAAGGKKVAVRYLARGVTWVPGYRIDLSQATVAKFSAQALIINELADFDHVELHLVTGFPNIRFGGIASPLAMSQSLAEFLRSLAGGRDEYSRSAAGMLTQQAVLVNAPVFSDQEIPPQPEYAGEAAGKVSEDLFLYPVEDFSLKRGETSWLPLFSAEMAYKHIYTWKIRDFLDPENRYRPDEARADGKTAEEIWHSCRLVNSLSMPLTTAAAEFVADGAFIGQDICYYTAPGAETTIRINRAMNILAEQAEVEVERRRNAQTFHGHSYDLVKVRGELTLRSRIARTVPVEIGKELSGHVLEMLPAARDIPTAKGLRQVNPKHVLTWEIELKPGAEVKLTYLYQVYIRD